MLILQFVSRFGEQRDWSGESAPVEVEGEFAASEKVHRSARVVQRFLANAAESHVFAQICEGLQKTRDVNNV